MKEFAMNRTLLVTIFCLGWAWASAGTYSGGTGTAENPYTISSADDWQELTVSPADWNGVFVLTGDIDLAGVALAPVGTDAVRFGGVFDGKGHILRNASIHLPDSDFVGLFGGLDFGSKIVNLGLENVSIQGHTFVGGLAGFQDVFGSIAACYVSGSVQGAGDIGGLVGINIGDVTFCYATVSVTGIHTVGGLVGSNYGDLDSCYSAGPVSGTGSEIGGLTGSNDGDITASLWDIPVSGQTTGAGGTGKTTLEMRTRSTFTEMGWDLVGETANGTADMWRLCVDGVGYPRLSWEYSVRGDFDCPGGVELDDLLYLSGRWLSTTPGASGAADGNLDGRIGLTDLVILAEHWKKEDPWNPPAGPVASFSRASIAYQNGIEYAANTQRSQVVAIASVGDGMIPAGEGDAGEHIEGCCYNGTYLFGLGMTSYRLYRSTDGVTWSKAGLYNTATDGTLWALANGNILLYDTANKKIFYSSDHGVSFTEGSITMTPGSYFNAWSFAQHGNTLLLSEYGPATALGGRYIHRSTDGGATWAQVSDLETQNPDGRHWHTVAYHSATGRWIAFFGDTPPIRGVMISDDDGLTWSNLHHVGDYPDQPVTCLDIGDPTRILVGCDGASCIAWLDMLTGELESIFHFGDGRSNRYYCWTLCKVGEVYYAGNFDLNKGNSAPVLWVSTDLVHWTVYHKFTADEGLYGFFAYIGYVGGKLHFQLQTTEAGGFRRFAISPAIVQHATGALVTPATTNLAKSLNLSSFETSNTWTGIGGMTAERYAMPYVGSYGLRVYGVDGSPATKNAYGPTIVLGEASTAKKYVLQARIKAARPTICMFRLYSQKAAGYYDDTKTSYILADKTWKHFRSYPFTVAAGDNGEFRPYLSIIQGTRGAEVFVDAFQIQEVPLTEWQVGGTAQAADILTATVTTPSAFTDLFTVQTIGMQEHYIAGSVLSIKTWKCDADNFVCLYFNPSDSRFYLQRKMAGITEPAVGLAPQAWHPYQSLKFALRADAGGLSMTIQNGRVITTITDGAMAAILSSAITMIYGDAALAGQFPGIYIDGTMPDTSSAGVGYFPLRLTDGDIASAFNLTPAAGGAGIGG